MKQSKFNSDASHLTNETIDEEIEDYYPIFYNAFAFCPLSQLKSYEILYNTQTRRDDLLF